MYVLTGEHGSGKTSVCTQVVAGVQARGLDAAGIITGRSGPEPDAPREVMDVRSGSRRLFGARTTKTPAGDAHSTDFTSDPLTPRWKYGLEVFTWASEVLSSATPCDLLLVDEVGPLELLGNRGWVSALDVLRGGDFQAALVVCRPSLVDALEDAIQRPLAGSFEADLENIDLVEGPVEAVLSDLVGPFDAVVVDPPRTGLDPVVIEELVRLDPPTLVYVSCDPATLARDARKLAEHGFTLADVQPVDMFPQTFHIETVAWFHSQ